MHLKDIQVPTFGTYERDLIWKPDPCRCSLGWGHWSRLYYNKPSWGWEFWTPKMDTDMHTGRMPHEQKGYQGKENMPTVASRWSQMVTPGSPTSSSKKTQTYFWNLSPAVLGNKQFLLLPPCLCIPASSDHFLHNLILKPAPHFSPLPCSSTVSGQGTTDP